MNISQDYIEALALAPHPEGGYFRQTYAAGERIPAMALARRYADDRAMSTAIYFLLRGREISHLHRLASDEVWHFYTGSAGLIVHILTPSGDYRAERLGPDIAAGERFQLVVPSGCWFGAEVADAAGFALVGNTVAPGFDFADFELARADVLAADYPAYADLIHRMSARPA